MVEIIRMPGVLAGADEAAIATWKVQQGSTVAADQVLAELETDKATVELNAESTGTVARFLAQEGENVAIGHPILVLASPGDDDAAIDAALAAAGLTRPDHSDVDPRPSERTQGETASTQAAQAVEADEPSAGSKKTPAADESGRQFVSPLVRRLAKEQEIDLSALTGTGPSGRIVRRDLERHRDERDDAEAKDAPDTGESRGAKQTTGREATPLTDFEDVPLDRMRMAIARRLTESKTTVPHFYLVADCNVDAMLALRNEVNKSAQRKISVNDFVLKAVACALMEVPTANSVWNGDSIRRFSNVDLAVAVATEGGLMTPVVRGVETMPISAVSAVVAELAERARAGRLKQHELEGGSFSISNLGMYGTSEFTAILNPPQAGILAVGAARKKPVVGDDGELSVASVMTVTLSADHRVLDGAVAAQWLAAFQTRIENPLTILI